MKFHILTLFPEMVMEGLHTSILARAVEAGHIFIQAINIRDYTISKHKKVDDYPYGGGAGMLMQAQPIYDAYLAIIEKITTEELPTEELLTEKLSIEELATEELPTEELPTEELSTRELPTEKLSIEELTTEELSTEKLSTKETQPRVIYLTPQGKVFSQSLAKELAKEQDLIFLCGHYEGIDERVLEEIVTDYVSIGDYVLTGGELPAMVMIDSISRLVPGVLNNEDSAQTESHHNNLLEYPQYSRPEVWRDKQVPDVLLSGHHAKIEKWRIDHSIIRTKERRPDMYEKYKLNSKKK